MSDSAMKDDFELIEIYGKPAMFTNGRIDRFTVPEGWYCYDLRGSDNDPGEPATVEQYASFNHAGAILLPTPIKFPSGQKYRSLIENREYALNFLDEDVTMEDFCERYGFPVPDNPQKYPLRPATKEEISFFYAADHETDLKNGNIGYVRMDFGRGEEFWHTWWPRGMEEWNSPAFKEELGAVVDEFRKSVLKDLNSMKRYCFDHSEGAFRGNFGNTNYGFVVETDRYRYCLRCNPYPGDYQAYLNCYDKQIQAMSMTGAEPEPEAEDMTMGGM